MVEEMPKWLQVAFVVVFGLAACWVMAKVSTQRPDGIGDGDSTDEYEP